jgi:hypothetical protein
MKMKKFGKKSCFLTGHQNSRFSSFWRVLKGQKNFWMAKSCFSSIFTPRNDVLKKFQKNFFLYFDPMGGSIPQVHKLHKFNFFEIFSIKNM